MHPKIEVKGLFISTPSDLNGRETSIRKSLVESLEIKLHGIPGNRTAFEKTHGGDMRVLHQYSETNYQFLKDKFPDIAERFVPGSFGENIYTDELTEADLCIGDIFKIGTAKIQITVPRRPCDAINLTYEDNRILKAVLNSYHVGWFFRVIEEGSVKLGDVLQQIDRPYPHLKLNELMEQGYGKNKYSNIKFIQDCVNTGLMDKAWMPHLEKVLTHHKI